MSKITLIVLCSLKLVIVANALSEIHVKVNASEQILFVRVVITRPTTFVASTDVFCGLHCAKMRMDCSAFR